MNAVVRPFRACGTIAVPSSKSELHRLLIAAALADWPTDIACRALSDDVQATLRCLRALGAETECRDGLCRVSPVAERRALPLLDCGESGSTLRFLLPVAAALGGARLTGGGRLPDRPIGDLLQAMRAHGARFSSDRLPLTVEGPLAPGCFVLPGQVSSQYMTGLMLAAPLIGETEIRIDGPLQSVGYVRMTKDILARFGVEAQLEPGRILIPGGQACRSPGTVRAGGDWSGAAFPLCLGALGGPVAADGLDEVTGQGDARVLTILREAGALVEPGPCVRRGTLRGLRLDVSDIPDLVPVLAALMMHAEGVSVFENAGRLRLKESDRLETVSAMVNALGGDARIDGDRLVVTGKRACAGGQVDGAGDHRIVMAAVVGASACTGPSEISGAEAVAKSWPGFMEAMRTIGGQTDVIHDR